MNWATTSSIVPHKCSIFHISMLLCRSFWSKHPVFLLKMSRSHESMRLLPPILSGVQRSAEMGTGGRMAGSMWVLLINICEQGQFRVILVSFLKARVLSFTPIPCIAILVISFRFLIHFYPSAGYLKNSDKPWNPRSSILRKSIYTTLMLSFLSLWVQPIVPERTLHGWRRA